MGEDHTAGSSHDGGLTRGGQKQAAVGEREERRATYGGLLDGFRVTRFGRNAPNS